MNGLKKKPGIAQLKTGVSVTAHTTRRPVAPPIYRPQPAPKTVQPKMANVVMNRKPPVAPPVYNPYQRQTTVQPKMGVGPRIPAAPAPGLKRPVGPPVYKPQVLQPKAKPNPGVSAQMNKRPAAPPVKPQSLQLKKTPAPVTGPGRGRSANTIQREVLYSAGSRTNVVNVAESVGRMVDFGITKTVLNGAQYPGGGRAGFVAALLEPRLRVERGHSSVAVSVEAVPTQRVSFVMELPTRDGWEMAVTAGNVKVKLENQTRAPGVNIPIADGETTALTLNVRGAPDDGTFADMVKTHEDVHVRDIQRAVDAVLRPWDTRLTNFCRLGIRFQGPTEMAATAQLYEAAGGTPEEIGGRFADTLRDLGDAFHDTDAGKGPVIVNIVRRGMLNRTLEVTLAHRAALGALHRAAQQEERERAQAERGVSRQLAFRSMTGSINDRGEGNSSINNDML